MSNRLSALGRKPDSGRVRPDLTVAKDNNAKKHGGPVHFLCMKHNSRYDAMFLGDRSRSHPMSHAEKEKCG